MVTNSKEQLSFAEEGLFYPPLRQRRPVGNRRWPTIEVWADSMRVGKSTAVEVLADYLRRGGYSVETYMEEWLKNPILEDSYADPGEKTYRSQVWFLLNKLEQTKHRILHMDEVIGIQDLPIEGDCGYALVNYLLRRLPPREFSQYQDLICSLAGDNLPAADLTVYLTASDGVLIDRAKKSAREFETVDEDYYLHLKQVNRSLLDHVRPYWSVLEVDTDVIDFSENGNHKSEFFEMVLGRLRSDGWRI